MKELKIMGKSHLYLSFAVNAAELKVVVKATHFVEVGIAEEKT